MGHMGDAWDVAHAALFLASDEAKYVTAAELVVDGGSRPGLREVSEEEAWVTPVEAVRIGKALA